MKRITVWLIIVLIMPLTALGKTYTLKVKNYFNGNAQVTVEYGDNKNRTQQKTMELAPEQIYTFVAYQQFHSVTAEDSSGQQSSTFRIKHSKATNHYFTVSTDPQTGQIMLVGSAVRK